ncbi:hypothetical protein SK128_026698 [Halocaridina rubra]|uniref:Uncharacterized protein n=1 Tax=Halocaridina rubra TaxID=373956 RepID=A0AAN8XTD6_HALRR
MTPPILEPQDTIFAVTQAILKVIHHSRNPRFIETVCANLQVNTLEDAKRRIEQQLWLILHKQQGVDIPPNVVEDITFDRFKPDAYTHIHIPQEHGHEYEVFHNDILQDEKQHYENSDLLFALQGNNEEFLEKDIISSPGHCLSSVLLDIPYKSLIQEAKELETKFTADHAATNHLGHGIRNQEEKLLTQSNLGECAAPNEVTSKASYTTRNSDIEERVEITNTRCLQENNDLDLCQVNPSDPQSEPTKQRSPQVTHNQIHGETSFSCTSTRKPEQNKNSDDILCRIDEALNVLARNSQPEECSLPHAEMLDQAISKISIDLQQYGHYSTENSRGGMVQRIDQAVQILAGNSQRQDSRCTYTERIDNALLRLSRGSISLLDKEYYNMIKEPMSQDNSVTDNYEIKETKKHKNEGSLNIDIVFQKDNAFQGYSTSVESAKALKNKAMEVMCIGDQSDDNLFTNKGNRNNLQELSDPEMVPTCTNLESQEKLPPTDTVRYAVKIGHKTDVQDEKHLHSPIKTHTINSCNADVNYKPPHQTKLMLNDIESEWPTVNDRDFENGSPGVSDMEYTGGKSDVTKADPLSHYCTKDTFTADDTQNNQTYVNVNLADDIGQDESTITLSDQEMDKYHISERDFDSDINTTVSIDEDILEEMQCLAKCKDEESNQSQEQSTDMEKESNFIFSQSLQNKSENKGNNITNKQHINADAFLLHVHKMEDGEEVPDSHRELHDLSQNTLTQNAFSIEGNFSQELTPTGKGSILITLKSSESREECSLKSSVYMQDIKKGNEVTQAKYNQECILSECLDSPRKADRDVELPSYDTLLNTLSQSNDNDEKDAKGQSQMTNRNLSDNNDDTAVNRYTLTTDKNKDNIKWPTHNSTISELPSYETLLGERNGNGLAAGTARASKEILNNVSNFAASSENVHKLPSYESLLKDLPDSAASNSAITLNNNTETKKTVEENTYNENAHADSLDFEFLDISVSDESSFMIFDRCVESTTNSLNFNDIVKTSTFKSVSHENNSAENSCLGPLMTSTPQDKLKCPDPILTASFSMDPLISQNHTNLKEFCFINSKDAQASDTNRVSKYTNISDVTRENSDFLLKGEANDSIMLMSQELGCESIDYTPPLLNLRSINEMLNNEEDNDVFDTIGPFNLSQSGCDPQSSSNLIIPIKKDKSTNLNKVADTHELNDFFPHVAQLQEFSQLEKEEIQPVKFSTDIQIKDTEKYELDHTSSIVCHESVANETHSNQSMSKNSKDTKYEEEKSPDADSGKTTFTERKETTDENVNAWIPDKTCVSHEQDNTSYLLSGEKDDEFGFQKNNISVFKQDLDASHQHPLWESQTRSTDLEFLEGLISEFFPVQFSEFSDYLDDIQWNDIRDSSINDISEILSDTESESQNIISNQETVKIRQNLNECSEPSKENMTTTKENTQELKLELNEGEDNEKNHYTAINKMANEVCSEHTKTSLTMKLPQKESNTRTSTSHLGILKSTSTEEDLSPTNRELRIVPDAKDKSKRLKRKAKKVNFAVAITDDNKCCQSETKPQQSQSNEVINRTENDKLHIKRSMPSSTYDSSRKLLCSENDRTISSASGDVIEELEENRSNASEDMDWQPVSSYELSYVMIVDEYLENGAEKSRVSNGSGGDIAVTDEPMIWEDNI